MKNFFKGISFTQVLAGSLAAVTSFLLASKIGIAGSVIGVAIGSIVSAVASQLYQNVIHASSRKLSEVNPNTSTEQSNFSNVSDSSVRSNSLENVDSKRIGDDIHMQYSSNSLQCNTDPSDDKNMAVQDARFGRTVSSQVRNPELENTRILELSKLREQHEEDMELSEGTIPEPVPLSKVVSENYGYSSGSYQNRNDHRTTIVVAVISALIAVIVTAGAVLLFTQGKGTDNIDKPEEISHEQQQNQPQPKQRLNTNTNQDHKKSHDDSNSKDGNEDENDEHGNENADSSTGGHSDNDLGSDTNNDSGTNSGDAASGNSGSGADSSDAGAGSAGSSGSTGSSNNVTSPGNGDQSGSANGN
ncbi:ATPase [Gardnerella swidsinskii]|uniref:ATPase n=1 Tax=Gardnerella swidsinskii TaxID=2792979 RepID=UPI0039EF4D3A